jgi:ABC-2 type transport system ATP-binding protein
MKQRLAIAATLLGEPSVLVLDEPTNGLDPVGLAEIRELIVELRKQGHTIIMASHLLDEVEKICTHVAILKSGSLVTSGEVEEILMDEDVIDIGANDLAALEKLFREKGQSLKVHQETNSLHLFFHKGAANPEEINRICFENGIVLNKLVIHKKRLETRFFELTAENQ